MCPGREHDIIMHLSSAILKSICLLLCSFCLRLLDYVGQLIRFDLGQEANR